jgi:hypothetical protein
MMPLKVKLLLIALTLTSCRSKGIKFDPIWHVGDHMSGQIVPREPYPIVSCFEPSFDQYACMHQDKVKELLTILHKARLPENLKTQIRQALKLHE